MSNDAIIDVNQLKEITDRFIEIIEDLQGYLVDSECGYAAYKKELELRPRSNTSSVTYAQGDPTDMSAIILHRALTNEVIARNSKEGTNVNRTRCHMLVMILEHWEADIRPKLAKCLNKKEKNDIKCEIMRDFNKIRQDILHNRGKVFNAASNKIIKFEQDKEIYITSQMLDLARLEVFKYLNSLFIEQTGQVMYPDSSLNQQAKKFHTSMSHKIIDP